MVVPPREPYLPPTRMPSSTDIKFKEIILRIRRGEKQRITTRDRRKILVFKAYILSTRSSKSNTNASLLLLPLFSSKNPLYQSVLFTSLFFIIIISITPYLLFCFSHLSSPLDISLI